MTPLANNALVGWHVHVKPEGVPIWLWLRRVSEIVWFRDVPKNWRSIVEAPEIRGTEPW